MLLSIIEAYYTFLSTLTNSSRIIEFSISGCFWTVLKAALHIRLDVTRIWIIKLNALHSKRITASFIDKHFSSLKLLFFINSPKLHFDIHKSVWEGVKFWFAFSHPSHIVFGLIGKGSDKIGISHSLLLQNNNIFCIFLCSKPHFVILT